MEKEQAQRLALATAAELRASRPRDRYKKRLAELVRQYKFEYRRAMIETYGAAKVIMRVPHLEVW